MGKKNIAVIRADVNVTVHDIAGYTKEEITPVILKSLTDEIAKQILKGFYEMPIEYRVEDKPDIQAQQHSLKVNIISTDEIERVNSELSRLEAIEKRYNTLIEAFGKQGMNVEFLKKEEQ